MLPHGSLPHCQVIGHYVGPLGHVRWHRIAFHTAAKFSFRCVVFCTAEAIIEPEKPFVNPFLGAMCRKST